ncbi:hypothetical protein BT67DRAFT_174741 [Trichocladium antarcticum]|uniref:Uncharacterized protein n=1 Tax=Trichocladium antarcticum TaxID=1450529 RepID=A0AAN6UP32_9PEZI|nr:hypothetical protein BT67DRAFT_174741 [Trichocladium antarcticum]
MPCLCLPRKVLHSPAAADQPIQGSCQTRRVRQLKAKSIEKSRIFLPPTQPLHNTSTPPPPPSPPPSPPPCFAPPSTRLRARRSATAPPSPRRRAPWGPVIPVLRPRPAAWGAFLSLNNQDPPRSSLYTHGRVLGAGDWEQP